VTAKRNDVWMPLYIGDYLRDTSRLTTVGHGAYLLLLMDYWVNGSPLPDDDDQLAAVARMPLKEWKRLRPTVQQFFSVADGIWRHKRVDAELLRKSVISATRSAAGKDGAEKKWEKQKSGKGVANATSEPYDDVWQNDAQSQSPLQAQEAKASLAAERAQTVDGVCRAIRVDSDGAWRAGIGSWLDKWAARGASLAHCLAGAHHAMSKKPPNFSPQSVNFCDWAVEEEIARGSRSAGVNSTGVAQVRELTPIERELDRWRQRVKRRDKLWLDSWGPQPGNPRCEVPPEILAEFKIGEAA
jgi:uncharacterized protein YdaU (DUF1376 family)